MTLEDKYFKFHSLKYFKENNFFIDHDQDIWLDKDTELKWQDEDVGAETVGFVDVDIPNTIVKISYDNRKNCYIYFYDKSVTSGVVLEDWMGIEINPEDNPEEFI